MGPKIASTVCTEASRRAAPTCSTVARVGVIEGTATSGQTAVFVRTNGEAPLIVCAYAAILLFLAALSFRSRDVT